MSFLARVPAGIALLLAWWNAPVVAGPAQDAAAFASAVGKINDAHVHQPGKNTEALLAKQIPASLKLEREAPDNKVPPSLVSQGSVMSLLIALHDAPGPKLIGKDLDDLEAAKKCRHINHVRYCTMADFHKALLAAAPDRKDAINKVFREP